MRNFLNLFNFIICLLDATKPPFEPVRKTVETTLPVAPQKNRVTVRNGSSGQPRKQYSIIPQLFISYGWGPLGK